MAGDGEVVLHDERDHLRGVLGGIDVPRQSEGYKYSFMSLKYIFILFDYFCTLWQFTTFAAYAVEAEFTVFPSFLYFPIAMLYSVLTYLISETKPSSSVSMLKEAR